jgi:endo-1,4-beta-xylanase
MHRTSATPARPLGRLALLAPLALLAACSGGGAPTVPAAPTTPTTPSAAPTDTMSLRGLVRHRALPIGVGTAVGSLFGRADAVGAQYTATLAREFDVITAENAMKLDALQPSRGAFRWATADSMVAFARANGMRVRGHTLIWHSQLPSWVTGGTYTRAQAEALLDDHVRAVAGHFRGQVAAWDVVNEAFTDGPVTFRPGFWANAIGRAYVERAFRAARAADPDVALFYNDYNIEGVGAKSDSTYAMLRDLEARGVPVDGIGMQMHLVAGQSPSRMAENFARFAALGLKIHVTELDVRVQTPPTAASLEAQARTYREVFAVCLQQPACEMVVTWGFTDRLSWIPSTFGGWGDALLFDASFAKKPAYRAVHDLLAGR